MCKKLVCLVSISVTLTLVNGVFAANWDDKDPNDNYWSSPNNWDSNTVPGLTDTVGITGPLQAGLQWPIMPADVNTTIAGFGMSGPRNPGGGQVGDPCLVIYGRLVVQPGLIILGSGWPGNVDNTGNVHLMPGSYWRTQRTPAENTVNALWTTQMGGDGTIVMDGGTWVADGVTISFNTGGGGTLRLNAGILKTYFFEMLRGYDPWNIIGFYPTIFITTCRSNMDIRQGTMLIDGDRTDDEIPYEKYVPYERGTYTAPYYLGREDTGINGYVNRGWITAYGQPNDPCDPAWYQPGNDPNNWWMPKRARVIVQYNPTGEMVIPESDHTGHTIVTAYLAGNGEAYDLTPGPYAVDVLPTATLTWSPGDYVKYGGLYKGVPDAKRGNGHHVFIHTNQSYVNGANLNYATGTQFGHIVGAQDANSFSVAASYPGGSLKLDTTYWWCVIEANDANVSPIQWTYRSLVQAFRTVGGKAKNPNPANSATAGIYVAAPLQVTLTWDKGFYTADTNGHRVYFGTNFNEVNEADTLDPQYKGIQTTASYLATGLELGKKYYWRIDEVNTAGPDPNLWPGDVWNFTVGAYRVVDEFANDNNDDDLRARWKNDPIDYACSLYGSGAILYSDTGGQTGRGMRFEYDNNDRPDMGLSYFSEGRFEYASGMDWTYGDANTTLRALALSYRGVATNDADETYDRLYVAVESTDGNMAIVMHDDPIAQRKTAWDEWNIDLRDFSDAGVNLTSVKYLYIGSGVRCNETDPNGGEGAVVFDNIRLYSPRCVGEPGYRQLGDLSGNCDVNWLDVDVLVGDWLKTDRLTGMPVNPADANLLARWEFEEGSGQTAGDSSGHGKNGTLGSIAGADSNDPAWFTDPVRGSCLSFDGGDYVDCGDNDSNVCGENYFDMPGRSYTVMCWVNQEESLDWAVMVGKGEVSWKLQYGFIWLRDMIHWQPGVQKLDGAKYNGLVSSTVLTNGQWYHVAATYDQDANWATLYVNGRYSVRANEQTFNPWSETYFCEHNPGTGFVARLLIGASDYSGYALDVARDMGPDAKVVYPLKGKIDDVRVYDRCLSEEEIMYVAGKTGPNYYPIPPPDFYSDIYSPEAQGSKRVNFKDLAVLAQDWMESSLWPAGF